MEQKKKVAKGEKYPKALDTVTLRPKGEYQMLIYGNIDILTTLINVFELYSINWVWGENADYVITHRFTEFLYVNKKPILQLPYQRNNLCKELNKFDMKLCELDFMVNGYNKDPIVFVTLEHGELLTNNIKQHNVLWLRITNWFRRLLM